MSEGGGRERIGNVIEATVVALLTAVLGVAIDEWNERRKKRAKRKKATK